MQDSIGRFRQVLVLLSLLSDVKLSQVMSCCYRSPSPSQAGVSVYQSTDLLQWQFKGIHIQAPCAQLCICS